MTSKLITNGLDNLFDLKNVTSNIALTNNLSGTNNLSSLSTRVLHINVPEADNFSSEFIYNFYHYNSKDDNEKLTQYKTLAQEPSLERHARYIKLNFSNNSLLNFDNSLLKTKFLVPNIEINNENEIENNSYYSFKLNDKTINEKLTIKILDALENNNQTFNNFLNSSIFGLSTTNVANNINFNGNNNINPGVEVRLEKQKDFFVRTQINKKYLQNISKVAKNSNNTFLADWEKIETSSLLFNSNDFNKSDSIPLNSWRGDSTPIFPNLRKLCLVGFIIKKYSFNQETGNYQFLETIKIINNPTRIYCDVNVLYGKNYKYDISCVYNLEIKSFIDSKYYSFFIESSIKSTFITTVENKSPDPPSDFFINWDYVNNCPNLFWRFPVETQRDIKAFQIFKRSSNLEAYKLICQQNFNDYSLLLNESIPTNLQKKSDNLYYKDNKFDLDKEVIYALACVDAHGNFSNLSKQIKVYFNKFTKKIETNVISQQNAPKFYPNLFLNDEFLLEAIDTDRINELTIYLDADTINVINLNSNTSSNIATIQGEFKINVLDLELEDSLTLNVNVNNRFI